MVSGDVLTSGHENPAPISSWYQRTESWCLTALPPEEAGSPLLPVGVCVLTAESNYILKEILVPFCSSGEPDDGETNSINHQTVHAADRVMPWIHLRARVMQIEHPSYLTIFRTVSEPEG